MKKIFLIYSLVFWSLAYSQDASKEKTLLGRKHEIKIGGIKLIAGPIFEGTYEYIYSKDFTFGSSVLMNLNTDSDYSEDFSLTPFARFYFQESKEYGAYGFFVEGFAKYYSGKYVSIYIYNEADEKKFSAAALGLSLGKKWVNNSGFVLELLVGVGRTIGNSNNAPEAVFRGDLNIGYRF